MLSQAATLDRVTVKPGHTIRMSSTGAMFKANAKIVALCLPHNLQGVQLQALGQSMRHAAVQC